MSSPRVQTSFRQVPAIADTSAWVRAGLSQVHDFWAQMLRGDNVLTCSVIAFELLYTARNKNEFAEIELELSALRWLQVTQGTQKAALTALRELSQRGAGYHRVPLADCLTAAAATEAGVAVLHYDSHFDRLAEVLNFQSIWIAPKGSL